VLDLVLEWRHELEALVGDQRLLGWLHMVGGGQEEEEERGRGGEEERRRGGEEERRSS